jgi:hypothetical protein
VSLRKLATGKLAQASRGFKSKLAACLQNKLAATLKISLQFWFGFNP